MMAGEYLKGGSTGWEQRGWTLQVIALPQPARRWGKGRVNVK